MARPKNKIYDSLDDHLDDIILKLFDPELDDNGNLRFVRNGSSITLEEMAIIQHYQDKSNHVMTKVGESKREARVLNKIKQRCNEMGYSDEDLRDVIYNMSNPTRQAATSKYINDSID